MESPALRFLNTGIMPSVSVPDTSLTQMPEVTIGVPKVALPEQGGFLDGLDLKGIGTLASVISGIMSANAQRSFQKEQLAMEKERIARDRKRQDKYESGMKSSWS